MKEKNIQIKLMGQIYTRAKETCIWLGESADDSDQAMDAIATLDGEDLDSPANSVAPTILAAIQKLQQRPWWSRVWAIQGANTAVALPGYTSHFAVVTWLISLKRHYYHQTLL